MRVKRIEVDLPAQELRLLDGDELLCCYPVSTSRNGGGELEDSECTPRGRHAVDEKIGVDCPINTVFVGRRPTGEIFDHELAARFPERDWILTRILWLRGLEEGVNTGGDRDSKKRYIYIHGTPDSTAIGRPGSRGCIRMRNADVVELFAAVETDIEVDIIDGEYLF